MKLLKIASALTVCTILCSCSFSENLMDEIATVNEIEQPTEPIVNNMPDVEMVADIVHEYEWYEDWCKSLEKGEVQFKADGKVKSRDVSRALAQLESDCPQIFWAGDTYYSEDTTGGTNINISVLDDVDVDEVPEMTEEIYEAAEKIIEQIPEGSSDYDKILFVHDYIINNTVYDYIGAKLDKKGMCHNIYGCLVNGKAVCIGYAEAFQLAMNMLDIEAGICTGSNHAWNYVKLDGEYYWLDATWDDNEAYGPLHTYFLITSEQLMRSRSFSRLQPYIPDCTANENNYIVRNGGYFEEYDEEQVLEYVGKCSDNEICEMMFGSFEVYKEALNALIAKGRISKADGCDNINYLRNDEMFCLTIIFDGEN